uniref:Uncharacterized protein n=1 Tax=Lepeophtheirus salmonis TaxID=72036 RepID=A0A0K2UW33_LEPSM
MAMLGNTTFPWLMQCHQCLVDCHGYDKPLRFCDSLARPLFLSW